MSPHAFPDTRPSVVRDVLERDADARQRALGAIAGSYWTPIHEYLVRRWRLDRDVARDVTQDFFAQAIERELFHQFDPTRARLRTFLRLCVDSHVRNVFKADGRMRRGGGVAHVELDDVARQVPADDESMDAWFEREWMRALFADALRALGEECRASGKVVQLAIFTRYDVEESDRPVRSTYAELAAAFGVPVTQVTNYLAWARRRMRTLVLDRLRAQCGSDAEYEEELQRVFGTPR